MASGTIKFFNKEKGFGKIADYSKGPDVFFHISAIKGGGTPVEGAAVTFDVGHGDRGPKASNVRLAGASAPAKGTPLDRTSSAEGKTRQSKPSFQAAVGGTGAFPYGFVRRAGGKSEPEAFHHRLETDRFDVAFEVVWTTQTPTALAPCEDPSKHESAVGAPGENTGYNKRWLMFDGKLAISPFTVKGALANGVANLLGGCYRVTERTEGHKANATAEGFPYTGAWKRYRVAMDRSFPGVIKEIDPKTGFVKVEKVIEYYLDQEKLSFPLKQGEKYFATTSESKHKHFVGSLAHKAGELNGKVEELTYHGPYRFGMDLCLKPGDMGKRHYHRFYTAGGKILEGIVPGLNFASNDDMQRNAYGGVFCKDDRKVLATTRNPRVDLLGQTWYQDLRTLKPGDWCYYTTFKDAAGKERIAAIGKNYQFKTFFRHDETLPPENKPCDSVDRLCPRCALFGMAGKEEDAKVVGYAGRFKSAALIADESLTPGHFPAVIPRKEGEPPVTAEFLKLMEKDGKEMARQFLLPVLGPPKPSKRDTDGYYDKDSGQIKGAKFYPHGPFDFDRTLPQLIKETDQKTVTQEGLPYGHHMRPVALICREGISFSGTIGAENCSPGEIAALAILLDHRAAESAFKLGLGKAFGMGSVISRIERLWFRHAESYEWQMVVIDKEGKRKEVFAALKKIAGQVTDDIKQFINQEEISKKINALDNPKSSLSYPAAGIKYWKDADIEVV